MTADERNDEREANQEANDATEVERDLTSHEESPSSVTSRSPVTRALMLSLGGLSLVLAVLGMFLPLLPTTPLVLLAAFFFARGSERAHRWLLTHRLFGPIVREWQEHRRIPERAKWISIGMVFLAFSFSIMVVPNCIYGYITLFVMGSGLVIFLASLKCTPQSAPAQD
ncbi:MAG: YbaN family protein [Planctomycetota bacterium]